ncbi:MAG: putative metal-binding motif-containing protein, partial [Myxococcota bacterium]|nr:putative metal-binding motif-containing protein [Myxococcota bacterium]
MIFLFTSCLPYFPFDKLFPEDPETDYDGDGYTVEDCDDMNPNANPGQEEVCDGIDNDCNNLIDENSAVDAQTWYLDNDADGYGTLTQSQLSCTQPVGWVLMQVDEYGEPLDDCEDTIYNINPGRPEICTEYDDDCDGSTTDIESDDIPLWYLDRDNDGWGGINPADVIEDCERPAGYVPDVGDCNDLNSSIYPNAPERCNEEDDDCDGLTDEVDANTIVDGVWYEDKDFDGFGTNDPDAPKLVQCDRPDGFALTNTDCDDNSNAVSPIGIEVCDEIDNDCDGEVDDGVGSFYFLDLDGDGYGRYVDEDGDGYPDNVVEACSAPIDQATGYPYSEFYTDCDDDNAGVNPASVEVCDGLDNDCNNVVDDDALIAPRWFLDADGDGYGTASSFVEVCNQPNSYVSNSLDCDDGRSSVNPSAAETCLTIYDDDCDNQTNDIGALGCTIYYEDADGDGYGKSNSSRCLCQADPLNDFTSFLGTDCQDSIAVINPGQIENCVTNFDDDCDGDTNDEGAQGCSYFYFDNDLDGFGLDTDRVCVCEAFSPYSTAEAGDCMDSDYYINPAVDEECDGLDNNCDGLIDQSDAIDAQLWYADADGDGFGDPNAKTLSNGETSPTLECYAPAGYVSSNLASDCDDQIATVNPFQTETCFTLYDDDCDGSTNALDATGCTTYYMDADGDGYGDFLQESCYCEATLTYPVSNGDDCDEGDATISPGAVEICDSLLVDENCDGLINDQDAVGCSNFFEDVDGDGYGSGQPSCLCEATGNFSATVAGDCDDEDPNISQAEENCYLSGSIPLSAANHYFASSEGISQLIAEDFNGDGISDIVLSTPIQSNTYSQSGAVYVFMSPLPSVLIAGTTSNADSIILPDETDDVTDLMFGMRMTAGNSDGDALGSKELLISDADGTYIFSGIDSMSSQAQASDGELAHYETGNYSLGTGFFYVGDVYGTGFDNAVYYDGVDSWMYKGNVLAQSNGLIASDAMPNGVQEIPYAWDWNGDGIQDILISDGLQSGVMHGASTLSLTTDTALSTQGGLRA